MRKSIMKNLKENKTILSPIWGGLLIVLIGSIFFVNQINKQVTNYTFISPYASKEQKLKMIQKKSPELYYKVMKKELTTKQAYNILRH